MLAFQQNLPFRPRAALLLLAACLGCGDDGGTSPMTVGQHDHFHVHAVDVSHEHAHAAEKLGGHTHSHQHPSDQEPKPTQEPAAP